MKLYTVVEAIPSRILGLVRVLRALEREGYTRSQLVDLVQPATLRKGDDANMANQVLSAAGELGLVEEYEDERGERSLRLANGARPPDAGDARAHLERWITLRVLRNRVDHEARDLARIFAWLMTIRPQDAPRERVSWKKRLEQDGLDLDELGLRNDARWDNLFDWARFLGLIWQTRASRDKPGVVCDPATLLSRFLDELLPPLAEEVSVGEFRTRLGKMFPSLDGGHVFKEVRLQVCAARNESPDQADRWSPGVGLALRELRSRGLLTYHCPDDQRTFMLFDDGERIAFLSRTEGGRS